MQTNKNLFKTPNQIYKCRPQKKSIALGGQIWFWGVLGQAWPDKYNFSFHLSLFNYLLQRIDRQGCGLCICTKLEDIWIANNIIGYTFYCSHRPAEYFSLDWFWYSSCKMVGSLPQKFYHFQKVKCEEWLIEEVASCRCQFFSIPFVFHNKSIQLTLYLTLIIVTSRGSEWKPGCKHRPRGRACW